MHEQVGHEDLSEPADLSDQHTDSIVQREDAESHIIDLYVIRTESEATHKKETRPIIHQVKLHGQKGEIVLVWGLFNNGAMVDVMSMETYEQCKAQNVTTGKVCSTPENGKREHSDPIRMLEGNVELGGATMEASFKVFDSDSGWD